MVAGPVNGDGVGVLEERDEVHCIGDVGVFYSEIVDTKYEGYGTGGMGPKARGEGRCAVLVSVEEGG